MNLSVTQGAAAASLLVLLFGGDLMSSFSSGTTGAQVSSAAAAQPGLCAGAGAEASRPPGSRAAGRARGSVSCKLHTQLGLTCSVCLQPVAPGLAEQSAGGKILVAYWCAACWASLGCNLLCARPAPPPPAR